MRGRNERPCQIITPLLYFLLSKIHAVTECYLITALVMYLDPEYGTCTQYLSSLFWHTTVGKSCSFLRVLNGSLLLLAKGVFDILSTLLAVLHKYVYKTLNRLTFPFSKAAYIVQYGTVPIDITSPKTVSTHVFPDLKYWTINKKKQKYLLLYH